MGAVSVGAALLISLHINIWLYLLFVLCICGRYVSALNLEIDGKGKLSGCGYAEGIIICVNGKGFWRKKY